jgi:hypothetical protein
MEKIIVFGATGGTSKLVVEQALQAGYSVAMISKFKNRIFLQNSRVVNLNIIFFKVNYYEKHITTEHFKIKVMKQIFLFTELTVIAFLLYINNRTGKLLFYNRIKSLL